MAERSVFGRAGVTGLLLAGLASGCAWQDNPPVAPLAGTGWRLVAFQSMDDAVGTQSPRDPFSITLQLQADGTAMLRVNCRQAVSHWTVTPGADTASGSFTLTSPPATPDCPAPDMEPLLAKQAPYLRSYLLKGDRLYLNLMADGGTLVWAPYREVPAEATADPVLEAAIRQAEPDYRRDVAGDMPTRYTYARTDLDGDGAEEVLAYLMGPFFCGTGGCNLLVFRQQGAGYQLVNDFPVSRLPVMVADEKHNGWRDLWRLESGGGAPSGYVRHVFDGNRYVERERVAADAIPAGTAVPGGAPDFAGAIPLPLPD